MIQQTLESLTLDSNVVTDVGDLEEQLRGKRNKDDHSFDKAVVVNDSTSYGKDAITAGGNTFTFGCDDNGIVRKKDISGVASDQNIKDLSCRVSQVEDTTETHADCIGALWNNFCNTYNRDGNLFIRQEAPGDLQSVGQATALGSKATTSHGGVAVGYSATAKNCTVVIGGEASATAEGDGVVAIGFSATATSEYPVVVGGFKVSSEGKLFYNDEPVTVDSNIELPISMDDVEGLRVALTGKLDAPFIDVRNNRFSEGNDNYSGRIATVGTMINLGFEGEEVAPRRVILVSRDYRDNDASVASQEKWFRILRWSEENSAWYVSFQATESFITKNYVSLGSPIELALEHKAGPMYISADERVVFCFADAANAPANQNVAVCLRLVNGVGSVGYVQSDIPNDRNFSVYTGLAYAFTMFYDRAQTLDDIVNSKQDSFKVSNDFTLEEKNDANGEPQGLTLSLNKATDLNDATEDEYAVTAGTVKAALAKKQDKLKAGANISIVDGEISATGGGGGAVVKQVATYVSVSNEGDEDSPELHIGMQSGEQLYIGFTTADGDYADWGVWSTTQTQKAIDDSIDAVIGAINSILEAV